MSYETIFLCNLLTELVVFIVYNNKSNNTFYFHIIQFISVAHSKYTGSKVLLKNYIYFQMKL